MLVAGAPGAAAVSMMAGAYLDAETSRDELAAREGHLGADPALNDCATLALVSKRLAAEGLTPQLSNALIDAVRRDHDAQTGLLVALRRTPAAPLDPLEQADVTR